MEGKKLPSPIKEANKPGPADLEESKCQESKTKVQPIKFGNFPFMNQQRPITRSQTCKLENQKEELEEF